MKRARALTPRTGDLFAVAAPGVLPAARAAPLSRAAPTPATPAPARRPAFLWYAVVFPRLEAKGAPRRLERLALIAQQYTSCVSLEPPNALLLEVQGSVRLFGSLERLQAALDTAWRRLELHVSSATAPTTLAALWLARGGAQARLEPSAALAGALAPLPIAVTGWSEEILGTLKALGVHRLGELLRLPRTGLARRFGPAILRDLDVALAHQAAPRRRFEPLERFHERRDCESEVETVTGLSAWLEPMIARCARFLRVRQAGVQALELELEHRDRPSTRVRLGLASITSDAGRLRDTVMHRLMRLELAAPVRRLALRSGPLRPLCAASLDVLASARSHGCGAAAPQLIERLRARLGEDAVYGVRAIDEHRPEAAWRRAAALAAADASRPARGAGLGCEVSGRIRRPIWLLEEPRLLSAADPPRSARGDLHLELGPERIESGWWDGVDVTRDYYRALEPGGARLWVFRDLKSGRWYLHGVFA